MPRRLSVRVLGQDAWPDARVEQRSYWLSRPPAARVDAGRDLLRRVRAWFHLTIPSRSAFFGAIKHLH
ncbi:MAG: hypothetical protein HYZ75_08715 [Elusimicrobia bacterium]|nr:hypothetical protein [Elusimicrobiota bacterium]